MDKDRIVGSAKQVKGAVKQVVGQAVGDAKLESEGRADKIEGKVQNAIGGIKDTIKGNSAAAYTIKCAFVPAAVKSQESPGILKCVSLDF
jgi:uncharacterized protein YjbJ (UPF0337 family)